MENRFQKCGSYLHYPTIIKCAYLKLPDITSFWNRFQFWNFPQRLPGIITELFHLPNFQAAYTSTILYTTRKVCFFGPNFLGLTGKSLTVLEERKLDVWNFLTLCTNVWSVCWLKFVKMEQFCDDSWKSLSKIPELETVPKW